MATENNHPVAKAIRAYRPPEDRASSTSVLNLQNVPGRGVSGIVDGRKVTVGQLSWLSEDSEASQEFVESEAQFAS